MSKRTKNLILLIAIGQISLIIGLLALPAVVQAIPGRYRVALSERSPLLSGITEDVIEHVAPVPTALPAALARDTATQVDISALLALQPTLAVSSPTPTMAVTAEPTKPVALEAQATFEATVAPTLPPTPAPTPTPEPTVTLQPLPAKVTLEGMGIVRQTFNNCGPANLTQVLNFYGDEITQAEVASYLKPNSEDRNVSPWQIADYVNEQTSFAASAHSGGTLEMLKTFIAAGLPVVVEKGYELPQSGWWGHYLTLFGYDDSLQQFYSQDSYLGPWDASGRAIAYDELAVFWQEFNYTFYIVYRPQDAATVKAILGPELLDEFTMWSRAASRADEERKLDPENPFVWFNLGTSLTRMGQLSGEADYYLGGAQAFDQAREIGLPPRMLWYQFRPYMAYWKVNRLDDVLALADATLATQGGRNVEETYWYKGHALLSQGNVSAAREAYQAALEVNHNFYPAQISLDSLN
jgi:hypothetical protein